MTKQEVRRQFLARRKTLSLPEVEDYSQQIATQLLGQLTTTNRFCGHKTVHTFLPIRHQQEVNTWLIIRPLWRYFPAVQLVASVTNFRTHSLTHYRLTDKTALLNNKWSIPEPVADEQTVIKSDQIDLVLVPLLCFDQRGHRVGYGGGFYDRFLATCRPDCLKIGLSLFEPIEQIVDSEPTDIRLNQCITATQIWQF